MVKADILVHGCFILPMTEKGLIENGAVAIKDKEIIFVGKRTAAAGMKAEIRIEAKGKAVLPGLINCHTHVPMTLFRGAAEDQPLSAWLKNTIWPLEAKITPEDVYNGALLGCLEMLKSGTTCFADMYFHEDAVAKAVKKSGLRGTLAEGIIESGNKNLGDRTLKKSVNFIREFNGYANGRVKTWFGPHAAYSCSPELLRSISEMAVKFNVGVHTHLAESKGLFTELEKKYGFTEVEFLDEKRLLNSRLLAAHCINLSETDMHLLAERCVNVGYIPVANMKLGLGAAKINDLVRLGVNVGLGTDSPASNNTLDMFETMKVAALLQKLFYLDPKILPAYQVLRMATINGAEALGLKKELGSLEVGKKADIILVDLSKPHLKPLHNVFASIIHSARSSDVDTVIVDGEIVMENRQVRTLDEDTVIERAEKTLMDLLTRQT